MLLNRNHQLQLLAIAEASIASGLNDKKALTVDMQQLPQELTVAGATFVTLKKQSNLRGCIGSLNAIRPIAEDVANNAYAAAFQDPRFQPLQPKELDLTTISVAVLSHPENMTFVSEADLMRQLQPKVDGLILQEGLHKSTFLPAVWEVLPTPIEFLQHLKQKAGLPAHYWSDSIRFLRYKVNEIKP